MNISTVVCDRHPLSAMSSATITVVSPVGDRNTLTTTACPHDNCTRHYTREFGYVDVNDGGPLRLGDVTRKRRCALNHEAEFMLLTKLDGVLTWACPVEQCNGTKLHGSVEGAGLRLSIRAIGHAGEGANLDNWKDVFQYAVQGLPPGEEAWIARMNGGWSTLRCSNGVQGEWQGNYEDPEHALENLVKRVERP